MISAPQLLMFLDAKQPRRLRVIENILLGKRSVSTLYWGMRYQLLDWLGYDKTVTREQMNQAVATLVTNHLITVNELAATVTADGEQRLADLRLSRYQPQALAVRLTVDVPIFWQRFMLAVQVVSEASYQNNHYYPLQVNWAVKQFVKTWYRDYKASTLPAMLNQFLGQYLITLTEEEATLFANLLVGHQMPGKTRQQIEQQTGRPVEQLQLMQIDLTCRLVQQIQMTDVPALHSLLAGLNTQPVSDSAIETVTAFSKGESLDQIAKRRRLKTSTVREHMLETAIFLPVDQFNYQRVLSDEQLATLDERMNGQPIDSWQFDQVGDLGLEFWQFRLYEILRSKQADD